METADVLKAVTNIADHERHRPDKEKALCKFLLVTPATSATSERAFLMARRVTLGANIMNQRKFYHVAILQNKNTSTDKIWLIDVVIGVA